MAMLDSAHIKESLMEREQNDLKYTELFYLLNLSYLKHSSIGL